jgi:hypothetical protein
MSTEKMSKDEIIRQLQEKGYRGRYIYIGKSHPDQPATAGATKASGIIADVASGMDKRAVARKYGTCAPYINRVLLAHRKGQKGVGTRKRHANLSYELWRAITGTWKGIGRTGGYVYVPVRLKGDLRASASGLNGQKTMMLMQEFSAGNFDARKLAENLETTIGFVYKVKSIWKKRGRLSLSKGDKSPRDKSLLKGDKSLIRGDK